MNVFGRFGKQYKEFEFMGTIWLFGKLIRLTYLLCHRKTQNKELKKLLGLALKNSLVCFDESYIRSFWKVVPDNWKEYLEKNPLLMRIFRMDRSSNLSEKVAGAVLLLAYFDYQCETIYKVRPFLSPDQVSLSILSFVVFRWHKKKPSLSASQLIFLSP